MTNVTRRRVLAGGLTIASGVLAGCFSDPEGPDTLGYKVTSKTGKPPVDDIEVTRSHLRVFLKDKFLRGVMLERHPNPHKCQWWIDTEMSQSAAYFDEEFDNGDEWKLTFMRDFALTLDSDSCVHHKPARIEEVGTMAIELTLP